MYKAIYASAWDLVDDGLDAVLERIRATGVNTITLAASQPAGATLASARRRPARRPARSISVPGPSATATSSRWSTRGERLRRACGAAAGGAGPRPGRLGGVLPRHAVGRAPGRLPVPQRLRRAISHRLCPAHPAVRDYVVNLCSDLARGYDLAAVVLETPGWLPCDQGYHPEFAADRWARTLLSFCFADATRHAAKAAGIDADRLQAQARELLERYRAADVVPAGMAAAWFADVVSEPEWAAFLDWRCRQVADLVIDVKAALPAGTALAVIPTVPHRDGAGRLEGIDIGMLAAAADALEIPVHQASAEEAYLDARDVRRRAGDDAALRFILRPGHSEMAATARRPGRPCSSSSRSASPASPSTTTTTSGAPAPPRSKRRSMPSNWHERHARGRWPDQRLRARRRWAGERRRRR